MELSSLELGSGDVSGLLPPFLVLVFSDLLGLVLLLLSDGLSEDSDELELDEDEEKLGTFRSLCDRGLGGFPRLSPLFPFRLGGGLLESSFL